MNNYVMIKGKTDRLLIHLDKTIDFETLRQSLEDKIKEAKDFIGNTSMAIKFINRELSEDEENQLIHAITENCNLKITYIFSENQKNEEAINLLTRNTPVTIEGITKFHTGNLRSGASLEYDGNIVIIGDVNPGAYIKAKGNVIVIGFLNGTVYAGLDGDPEAFVGAVYMNPVQLAIGNIIAPPLQKKILDTNKINRESDFKIARIEGHEIIYIDMGKK